MANGLTVVGYLWVTLSATAAAAVSISLFIPVWIEGWISVGGDTALTSFGCFRRCTYPKLDTNSQQLTLVRQCGRYRTFHDIPSLWWQITTITISVGASMAVLVAFISLPACVCSDIISRTTARLLGVIQALAGWSFIFMFFRQMSILICVGCILYPLGWDAREVQEACGWKSRPFILGQCRIGWAFYVLLASILVLILSACLSTKAGRPLEWRKLPTSPTHNLDYDDHHDMSHAKLVAV